MPAESCPFARPERKDLQEMASLTPSSLPDPEVELPKRLQDLTPSQAHFCLAILRFMEKALERSPKGLNILCAFSGGADSTALLLALHWLKGGAGFTLKALHLDHGLRPSSAAEAQYCRDFCSRLGLDCLVRRMEVKKSSALSGGLEEKSRQARYSFFAEQAAECRDSLIATAHNSNDLAEDILMRLIRGTGWPGLAGMQTHDARRRLVRPLLDSPRSAIEDFLNSLGLSWIHDESNQDRSFFRNRVRLDIIPLLLRENPAFLKAAGNLRNLGQTDAAYFDALLAASAPEQRDYSPEPQRLHADMTASVAAAQGESLFVSGQILQGLHQSLRLRLYKKTLDALGPGQTRLATLLETDAAWLAGKGKSVHLIPGGKSICVTKKGLTFFAAAEKKESTDQA
ncbi:MAG: tRNA lysidine(34) synthetase TilS [Desulfovibrio sp.]|jgi:tRNA(Ile)-lysidine synthase|nr:tRNA lysidine(34) synthetase TilS [Desulfovibrio sp.]